MDLLRFATLQTTQAEDGPRRETALLLSWFTPSIMSGSQKQYHVSRLKMDRFEILQSVLMA